MGCFNLKCALTSMNISSGDMCHGFYLSKEPPFQLIGYAYGKYNEYGGFSSYDKKIFSTDLKNVTPCLFLHDKAIHALSDADVDNISLEYSVTKHEIIPDDIYECLIKTLKIKGFQFWRDYLINYNSQPDYCDIHKELQLRELLYIYKCHEDSWHYEETNLVCHLSGIPLRDQFYFYQIDFLRQKEKLVVVRERKYKFARDENDDPIEKGEIISDIRNSELIIEDYCDKVEGTYHGEYFSIYVCEDIYNYIRKHSCKPQLMKKFATSPTYFVTDKNKETISIIFSPESMNPFIKNDKTTSFELIPQEHGLIKTNKYSIITAKDFFNKTKEEKIALAMDCLFYYALTFLWTVNPYSGLSSYGDMNSLKAKPREFFLLKKSVLEDFIQKKRIDHDNKYFPNEYDSTSKYCFYKYTNGDTEV